MTSSAFARRVVPMIVASGLFMQNLDSTVIATALPAIAQSLGEDPLRLNLAITSYLLSLAVFIPLSGWTADRFGASTVFRLAIVVFTLGSIACGFADTLYELVAARVMQGMGGAMMVPVARLLLLKTVPKSELVSAMAYLTVPALIGPVVGPPLGGLIVTFFSWHWIFFINVPIGIIGIALVTWLVKDIREEDPGPLDLRGFALSGVALAGLVFGLETIGRNAIPEWATASLLLGGVLLGGVYLLHMRRVPAPIVDLTLLAIPTFRSAILGSFVFRVGVGALPFLLPMLFQVAFGLSPLSSGLLTFASAAGAMAMKFSAGPIIRAFGFRRVLLGNIGISSLFLFLYGLFTPETPHLVVFAALLAGGFFRSLQFTATNTLAFADVPPARMSRATSLSGMIQQLSLSAGVAFGALVLHLSMTAREATVLSTEDFLPAFLGVGLVALASAALYMSLADDAGAEVSGHRK